ncbi:VCBS domain-containing protein, partial [Methylobacterium cerastii]|uniref:VCBS domain-containing protein n=1 Tax=Methylobacterium cerastii TaxID=932741 RepID=UPI001EE34DCE
TGVNDAPVVSAAVTGTGTEDGAKVTLNALTNATDVDHNTALSVVSIPSTLPAGVTYDEATHSFVLDPANAAYQTLAQGETQTVSVTYAVSDGIAAPVAQSILFTVIGVNDAAVISGNTIGAVVEAGGVANAMPGTPTATGALTAMDVDSAATFQAVSAGAAATYGTYAVTSSGVWTYNLNNANAAVQALNTTSTPLTDMFKVLTADGTAQSVTVTINGANDAATISGTITGSVTEAGGGATAPMVGTPSATGTLTATDVDNLADTFQPVTTAQTTAHGTYTVTKAGVWTYNLNNTDTVVQALNTTSTPLTDAFTVLTADGTAQAITVTIKGTNDAPVAIADTTALLQRKTADGNVLTNDRDVDSGDTLQVG